jgi:hypothetical protein
MSNENNEIPVSKPPIHVEDIEGITWFPIREACSHVVVSDDDTYVVYLSVERSACVVVEISAGRNITKLFSGFEHELST